MNIDSAFVILLSDVAQVPAKATEESVGYDCFSARDVVIQPETREVIDLDLTIVFPPGVYGKLESRSGLAFKHQVDVKAGILDPDFRGNIGVLLHNHGKNPFIVKIGDRIAQLIFHFFKSPKMIRKKHLDEFQTERGAGSFGSSGDREFQMERFEMEQFLMTPPMEENFIPEVFLNAIDLLVTEYDPYFNLRLRKVVFKGKHYSQPITTPALLSILSEIFTTKVSYMTVLPKKKPSVPFVHVIYESNGEDDLNCEILSLMQRRSALLERIDIFLQFEPEQFYNPSKFLMSTKNIKERTNVFNLNEKNEVFNKIVSVLYKFEKAVSNKRARVE